MPESSEHVNSEKVRSEDGRWVYMLPVKGPAIDSPVVNLRDLVAVLSKGKLWIVIAALLGAVAGAVYAFQAAPWYRAEVVLAPADRRNINPGLGQLSGLAGLAGINLPVSGAAEPVAMLQSRELVSAFISSRNLLPILFREKWDAATGRWRETDVARQPDIRDGVVFFDRNIRRVVEDRKTGLITLVIEWKDPKVAADWASMIVLELNERARSRALEESQRSVDYLRKELASNSLVPLQQSISSVLEMEMQQLVLARGSREFALKTIDAAVPPRHPFRPMKKLVVALSAIGGGFLMSTALLIVGRRRWIPAAER